MEKDICRELGEFSEERKHEGHKVNTKVHGEIYRVFYVILRALASFVV
jgi:hypothetical protein